VIDQEKAVSWKLLVFDQWKTVSTVLWFTQMLQMWTYH